MKINEELIVKLHKEGNTFKQIANIFNVSRDTIRDRLRKNNIVLPSGQQRIKIDVSKAYDLYCNGKTLEQVANIFNVSSTTIIKNFEESGLNRRKQGKRTIKINDFAFSVLSNDCCYWAGFLAADGGIVGNSICLKIHINDIKHIKDYKDFLSLDAQIRMGNYGRACGIRYRSDQIKDDLKNKFNIVPCKSLILQPPNLQNKDFIRNYIRGYFDGDGCFSYSKRYKVMNFEIYSGSPNILEWLLSNIKDLSGINSKANVKYKKNNTYRFSICGNKNVIKVMDWLYQDKYYLKRKRDKYEETKSIIGG